MKIDGPRGRGRIEEAGKPRSDALGSEWLCFTNILNKVVIGSHTDCILQQLVVILTASNNLIGSQYDYQLNYSL